VGVQAKVVVGHLQKLREECQVNRRETRKSKVGSLVLQVEQEVLMHLEDLTKETTTIKTSNNSWITLMTSSISMTSIWNMLTVMARAKRKWEGTCGPTKLEMF